MAINSKIDTSFIGKRFGRLIVENIAYIKNYRTYFNVKCDCGAIKASLGKDIKAGKIKSCGCLNKEKVLKAATKHNSSKTKLYKVWRGMRRRCSDPKTNSYHIYGGKGINVCKEWENSFEKFKAWALSSGYKEGLSIDRIDNNGNYEPANCRWATQKEQCNNNSRNRHMTYNGKTQTAQQWSDELGISRGNITHRINIGWSTEKILSTPVRKLVRKNG